MNSYPKTHQSVEHLLAEHRRLHVMLRLARSAILHSGGPDRNGTTADVVRVLRQVRDSFAHHFAEEEASKCLEEVAARCPKLCEQSRRIQSEHSELLRDTDKLIAQALDSAQTVEDRVAIEKAFDDLCEQLFAHEAAENELLREGSAIGLRDEVPVPTLTRDA
jgi:hemerythrin